MRSERVMGSSYRYRFTPYLCEVRHRFCRNFAILKTCPSLLKAERPRVTSTSLPLTTGRFVIRLLQILPARECYVAIL